MSTDNNGQHVEERDRALEFAQHRPLLFGIAYRMLGSATEAEDIVQDAFLRWEQVGDVPMRSERSYLASIVTNLCIDHLRSARVRRETYVGPWLPEPLVVQRQPDVADLVVLTESLTMAFLALLERLSPTERAVFLLHDVFGFEFKEISSAIGKSPANCRQIGHRARSHLAAARPRLDPPSPDQLELAGRFVQATTSGDVEALLSLLSDDVTLVADSDGKVLAPRRPVVGVANIVRFLLGIMRREQRALTAQAVWINNQPGVLTYAEDDLIAAVLFDVIDGRIATIRFVANPDKLANIGSEGVNAG